MARKFIQTKKTTLTYGISDASTTIQLSELLKLDGTSVSASDIGDILYGTFSPGTSREEIFSVVGSNVTIESDGKVTITSVTRGLKEVDPYTTGGYSCDHPAGETIIFGNNPQVYDAIYDYINAAVVAGGVPATDAVPGLSMEGTQDQVDAGTTQETYNAQSYDLFVRPDTLRAKKYHDAVASATGTDAYAITVVPAITAYATYQEFTFIADVANTGACTLNVSGLGAKSIKKDVSLDTATGDILAGQVVKVMYDGTNMQIISKTQINVGLLETNKTDGDLIITSGITNIDLGSADLVVKNYKTLSITGTASITFSNPHTNGTTIIFLCESFVCTSSTSPAINASGMGAVGGIGKSQSVSGGGGSQTASGSNGTISLGIANYTGNFGALGTGITSGAVGGAIPTLRAFGLSINAYLQGLLSFALPGAGGGSGGISWLNGASSQNVVSGAGGTGGGSLCIISNGSWNFTSVISVAGAVGGIPTVPNTSGQCLCGGGGAGGGGVFYGLYKILIANSGTVTVDGGVGANALGDNASGNVVAGGAGGGGVTAGGNNAVSTSGSKTGGDGGDGLSIISQMY